MCLRPSLLVIENWICAICQVYPGVGARKQEARLLFPLLARVACRSAVEQADPIEYLNPANANALSLTLSGRGGAGLLSEAHQANLQAFERSCPPPDPSWQLVAEDVLFRG